MQNLEELNFSGSCLKSLSEQELCDLNGGSFWGDLAYVAGATIKCVVVFCKTAAEYQASLPPNLKK
jgi:natural product precursor